ncbi:MAG: XRE family transcriptional regulator [Spirochaetota bacterium]
MLKNEVRYRFGDKLRTVRERRGMTLKETALKAGLSESLISQIERNRVSPSIDTLISLADILKIDLEYLFKDFKQNKKVGILRSGEGARTVMEKVIYKQLSVISDPVEEHSIEAFLLEIEPEGEKGSYEYGHPGKEFGFLLEGKGILLYGTETYTLNVGDSIAFPSDIPHVFRNTGGKALKAVWVVTPPRLFLKK